MLAAAIPVRAALLNPVVTATSTGSVNVSWTPGTSPYIAVISASASFIPAISSGSAAANGANYASLNPDTTYYLKVKSSADPDSQYSQTSTATWAAAPSGTYFISSYFTAESSATAGAQIGWSVNNNPEWTDYDLDYALNSSFTGAASSPKGYPPVILGGLNANTTYYCHVRARAMNGTPTAYAPAISTATLALKLSGLSDAVYETSATVTWTPVSSAVQALNSEGYRLLLSTSPLLTPLTQDASAPSAAASSFALAPLTRNTTYYYRAGALNWNAVPNLGNIRSFTTLASKPEDLSKISFSDGAGTLGWTALPAGPASASALGYRLEASTAGFSGGVILSSTVYGVALSTLTIPTLEANTTYYFRAASLNSAYIPNYTAQLSSVTLALPLSSDLVYLDAAQQGITVYFTPMQAAPQAFACEGYRFEVSTAPFDETGAVISSTTYQSQLGELTINGLKPNKDYYARIATLNWERTPNYTALPAARTGLPGALTDAALQAVWQSSAAISFTPNPATDGYVAEASTYQYFNTVAASSSTSDPLAAGLVITGLNRNTVYYYRAGALFNGTTVYAGTYPDERSTLPLTLSGLQTSAVYNSSVTVSWTPLASSPQNMTAEKYVLEAATSTAFSPVLFSSYTQTISSDRLALTGLSPNTSYYFRAGTMNWEDRASYSYTPATSTMANLPLEQAQTGLTPFTMTINWLPNYNPPDTLYSVRLSPAYDFTSDVRSSATVNAYAAFTGLAPNTTYYAEVTAYNRLNRPSAAVPFPPLATGAYDPDFAAYGGSDVGISSLTIRWGAGTPVPNPAGTFYLAQISSSPAFGEPLLSSSTTGLNASFGALASDTSYYLRVSALNLTGVATDPVSLGTALTLPATAFILTQEQTFSDIMTDGFTVHWAANGNSTHTIYNVGISTYNTAVSGAANLGAWKLSSSASVQGLACTFKDLSTGATYWAYVESQGQTGIKAYPVFTDTVATLRSANAGTPVSTDTTISLLTSYGLMSVFIPAGALGGYTQISIHPGSSFMPPASAVSGLIPTGIGLVVDHFPPVLVINPVIITVPYRLSDLPAGTDRTRLILALYDEANAVWVPLPSTSDTANNRVTGQTWHLSTFQIMQTLPETGFSDIKIYPNPYMPNSVSGVMSFANMPPYARVKIYTFLGELVREVKADVNGMAHWDGLNKDGRKAASGVYIAFIQTKDGKSSKSLKIAVER